MIHLNHSLIRIEQIKKGISSGKSYFDLFQKGANPFVSFGSFFSNARHI